MNCTCGHRLRTIEDLDSGECVRCRRNRGKTMFFDNTRELADGFVRIVVFRAYDGTYTAQSSLVLENGSFCLYPDFGHSLADALTLAQGWWAELS